MAEQRVVVDAGAAGNGMANMVAELIRANVAGSRWKARCFGLLRGTVLLDVPDAEVKARLVFERGACTVYDGAGAADLSVTADSESLLQLSNLTLFAGLPWYADEKGRAVVRTIVAGKVKVTGLPRHLLTLTLLTIVLSVN